MINKYVAMGLGAFIALAPVAALAQEQVAQAATDTTMASPQRPSRAHTAATFGARATQSAHRARASAHHMHKMRTAPAEAPKS